MTSAISALGPSPWPSGFRREDPDGRAVHDEAPPGEDAVDEAEAIVKRLSAVSHSMLGGAHGLALINAARAWVATYAGGKLTAVEEHARVVKAAEVAPKKLTK